MKEVLTELQKSFLKRLEQGDLSIQLMNGDEVYAAEKLYERGLIDKTSTKACSYYHLKDQRICLNLIKNQALRSM